MVSFLFCNRWVSGQWVCWWLNEVRNVIRISENVPLRSFLRSVVLLSYCSGGLHSYRITSSLLFIFRRARRIIGIMQISVWSIGDWNWNDPLTDLLTRRRSYQSLLVAQVECYPVLRRILCLCWSRALLGRGGQEAPSGPVLRRLWFAGALHFSCVRMGLFFFLILWWNQFQHVIQKCAQGCLAVCNIIKHWNEL